MSTANTQLEALIFIYQMVYSTGTERSPNTEKNEMAPKTDATLPNTYTGNNDYIQFLEQKRGKSKASSSLLIKMLLYNEHTKATRLLNHFRNSSGINCLRA